MKVVLNDVVDRITGNVDRFNTDLDFYVGGEHYENECIAIYNPGLLKSEKDNRSTNSKETNDEEDNEITSLTNATFSTNLENDFLFYIFFLLNIVRIKFILYDFGLFNNS